MRSNVKYSLSKIIALGFPFQSISICNEFGCGLIRSERTANTESSRVGTVTHMIFTALQMSWAPGTTNARVLMNVTSYIDSERVEWGVQSRYGKYSIKRIVSFFNVYNYYLEKRERVSDYTVALSTYYILYIQNLTVNHLYLPGRWKLASRCVFGTLDVCWRMWSRLVEKTRRREL